MFEKETMFKKNSSLESGYVGLKDVSTLLKLSSLHFRLSDSILLLYLLQITIHEGWENINMINLTHQPSNVVCPIISSITSFCCQWRLWCLFWYHEFEIIDSRFYCMPTYHVADDQRALLIAYSAGWGYLQVNTGVKDDMMQSFVGKFFIWANIN